MKSRVNDGYFTQEKLDTIWKDYRVAERVNLLNLMKQENFEICYALSSNDNTYIAPQLLNDRQPHYDWDDSDSLKFRFQYKFMPEGIITRLIVRLNGLIAKNDQSDLSWLKGVLLEQNGCRAQVREEDNRDGLKVIDIAVTGNINQRKFLLHTIREEIQEIHRKWFKNIQAEQMIPCLCDYCSDTENTEAKYFASSVLERARGRGKSTIECDKDFLDVPVMTLLEGVFIEQEIRPNSHAFLGGKDVAVVTEPEKKGTVNLFISYSHKDEEYKEELELCLKSIQRRHSLKYWEDRQILAGEAVDSQILEKLESADIVVLLISRDFIVSDYCFNKEMDSALKIFKEQKNIVIPIIIRETAHWHEYEIGQNVALPKDGKPLNQWQDKDSFWADVEKGITKQVERRLSD